MGGREKGGVIGGCCLVILLISGGLVGCSFSILEYNQVGIDFDSTSQSIDEEKLFKNGRHFIGLAHSFFVYPTKLLTVEFAEDRGNGAEGQSGALTAGSKDGQAIEIELSFFVRINVNDVMNVVNLYKEYRTTFMPTVLSKVDTCMHVHVHVPGPPYCTCTYGLRAPASCVPYVPKAQGSLPRAGTTIRTP